MDEKNRGEKIEGKIKNNCELSATRAFVVAKYIDLLVTDDVNIFYSAEGAIGTKQENPENRRVRINITFTGINDNSSKIIKN